MTRLITSTVNVLASSILLFRPPLPYLESRSVERKVETDEEREAKVIDLGLIVPGQLNVDGLENLPARRVPVGHYRARRDLRTTESECRASSNVIEIPVSDRRRGVRPSVETAAVGAEATIDSELFAEAIVETDRDIEHVGQLARDGGVDQLAGALTDEWFASEHDELVHWGEPLAGQVQSRRAQAEGGPIAIENGLWKSAERSPWVLVATSAIAFPFSSIS